jgi:fibrillarin-like pre-rRNA processing protein
LYQDVAQPDQDRILAINARQFLKKGGIAMLCVKSQSIDVTMDPKKVFAMVEKNLSSDFEIIEKFYLEPYDKEHEFLVLRLK